MMSGSVPQARQNAVSIPMSGKTRTTLADVLIPVTIIPPIARQENPCFFP